MVSFFYFIYYKYNHSYLFIYSFPLSFTTYRSLRSLLFFYYESIQYILYFLVWYVTTLSSREVVLLCCLLFRDSTLRLYEVSLSIFSGDIDLITNSPSYNYLFHSLFFQIYHIIKPLLSFLLNTTGVSSRFPLFQVFGFLYLI